MHTVAAHDKWYRMAIVGYQDTEASSVLEFIVDMFPWATRYAASGSICDKIAR